MRLFNLGLSGLTVLALLAVNANAMGQKPPKGTWGCEATATCTDFSNIGPGPGPGNPGGGHPGPTITTCYYSSDYTQTKAEAEKSALDQCKSDGRNFADTCQLDGCQKY